MEDKTGFGCDEMFSENCGIWFTRCTTSAKNQLFSPKNLCFAVPGCRLKKLRSLSHWWPDLPAN